MIDSILDMITEATSNTLFIFCLCNLIIVIILHGFKLDIANDIQECGIPLSMTNNVYAMRSCVKTSSLEHNASLVDVIEMPASREWLDAEENEAESCVEEAEDETDDELRRRVEEFIAKVNKEWMVEKLRGSSLV